MTCLMQQYKKLTKYCTINSKIIHEIKVIKENDNVTFLGVQPNHTLPCNDTVKFRSANIKVKLLFNQYNVYTSNY